MILWKHNLFKWSVTILLARSPGLQSRRMLGEHSTIPKLLALSLTWKRCQSLILDEKINQRLWQSMNTSIPMTSKFGEKKCWPFWSRHFQEKLPRTSQAFLLLLVSFKRHMDAVFKEKTFHGSSFPTLSIFRAVRLNPLNNVMRPSAASPQRRIELHMCISTPGAAGRLFDT